MTSRTSGDRECTMPTRAWPVRSHIWNRSPSGPGGTSMWRSGSGGEDYEAGNATASGLIRRGAMFRTDIARVMPDALRLRRSSSEVEGGAAHSPPPPSADGGAPPPSSFSIRPPPSLLPPPIISQTQRCCSRSAASWRAERWRGVGGALKTLR